MGVVYNENKRGPRTEPWGIPRERESLGDDSSPIVTA